MGVKFTKHRNFRRLLQELLSWKLQVKLVLSFEAQESGEFEKAWCFDSWKSFNIPLFIWYISWTPHFVGGMLQLFVDLLGCFNSSWSKQRDLQPCAVSRVWTLRDLSIHGIFRVSTCSETGSIKPSKACQNTWIVKNHLLAVGKRGKAYGSALNSRRLAVQHWRHRYTNSNGFHWSFHMSLSSTADLHSLKCERPLSMKIPWIYSESMLVLLLCFLSHDYGLKNKHLYSHSAPYPHLIHAQYWTSNTLNSWPALSRAISQKLQFVIQIRPPGNCIDIALCSGVAKCHAATKAALAVGRLLLSVGELFPNSWDPNNYLTHN